MSHVLTDNKNTKMLQLRVTGILFGLGLEYVVGMLQNIFFGSNDQTYNLWGHVTLGLHSLIGLGLLIGTGFIWYASHRVGNKQWKKMAIFGFIGVIVAMISGILTVVFKGGPTADTFSLLMSLGFLAAFAAYGYQLFLMKKDKLRIAK